MSVVDCFIEDRGEAVDEFPSHRRSDRSHAPPATVAQHSACLERAPKLCCFLELVRLERDAEVSVNLVELALAEERQQVVGET